MEIPAGLDPALAGVVLAHGFVIDPMTAEVLATSNGVSLVLVP